VTTIKAESQPVQLGSKARPFGRLHATADAGSEARPAASITRIGRGQIAATYVGLGRSYRDAPNDAVRAFLAALARELFPEPRVEVTGSHDVDVCLMQHQGRLAVHLVNTAGPHRTQSILESIPPVGPLTVSLRETSKPSKVTLEPSGIALAFDYRDGRVQVQVPKLAIHEAVVVTP
jgi:hypothetical protein